MPIFRQRQTEIDLNGNLLHCEISHGHVEGHLTVMLSVLSFQGTPRCEPPPKERVGLSGELLSLQLFLSKFSRKGW